MDDIKCSNCNGTNSISNQAYWDEYEHMEKTYPSEDMIEKQLEQRGLTPTIPCPNCKKTNGDKWKTGVSMTTKNELYKLIDKLTETQLVHAKEALTNVIQGKITHKVPICDLGFPEDIATLYESVVYDENKKI